MDVDVLVRIYDVFNELLDSMTEEERMRFLKDHDDCVGKLNFERDEENEQF